MADALASGASSRKGVRVQVPPRPPKKRAELVANLSAASNEYFCGRTLPTCPPHEKVSCEKPGQQRANFEHTKHLVLSSMSVNTRDFSHLVAPLHGTYVSLEPLGPHHIDELARAATGDRSTFRYTRVPDGRKECEAYTQQALDDQAVGQAVAFAIRKVTTEEVVGSTRFMACRWYFNRRYPDVVEIGGTWLAASVQRSVVNSECKLLLLRRAFDDFGVGRVDLKTDSRNDRSFHAMIRLGANYEGTARQAHPSLVSGEEGLLRDSAIFAITREQWPAIHERLVATVARAASGP